MKNAHLRTDNVSLVGRYVFFRPIENGIDFAHIIDGEPNVRISHNQGSVIQQIRDGLIAAKLFDDPPADSEKDYQDQSSEFEQSLNAASAHSCRAT